ncbi:Putative alkyl/aryl-sulfatase YjcS [Candidatus Hepatincola sp. Av]
MKLLYVIMALLVSCNVFAVEPTNATQTTINANNKVKKGLNFSDQQDFADIRKGFIADFNHNILDLKDSSKTSWDFSAYKFQKGEAPNTVNPSLWRQAILNNYSGLFKVTDNIYQIRGADLSNMSIIETKKGIIIIDPLTTPNSAKAALDLYYEYRPKKPVIALIYTHSHVDHFGGVRGVIDEKDVKSGKIPVIAPDGFLEEAVSENVFAGTAMLRRAMYPYGLVLPTGAKGQLDAGLGKNTSKGTYSLIPPTVIIDHNHQQMTIGGVKIDFWMTPNTEAPSEMVMYFPQFKALLGSEVVTHTLHNLYTLRGAKVRDAVSWWKSINAMIDEYGDKSDVIFESHHWPMWGQENIQTYLENQRDMYKSIHDQTLFYANQGYTMNEIAEMVKIPDAIANKWYNRGYYGTVSVNVKAVYQRYLGWFDENPSNLNPLPPVEESKKYVAAMGGINKVISMGQTAYNQGDYRWAATLLKHAVYAQPNNTKAKNLLATVYDQLGYQAESPLWRNTYLVGAYELRNGKPKSLPVGIPKDLINSMTIPMFFDYFAITLDPKKTANISVIMNWKFTDIKEEYGISLKNTVFTYSHKLKNNPDLTVTLTKATFNKVNVGEMTFAEGVKNGSIKVTGDVKLLDKVFKASVKFNPLFNIVTP